MVEMKQFQSSNGTIWNFPDSEQHFIMMLNSKPEYQDHVKSFILQHADKLDFNYVLDIGANVGLWTRWFSNIGAKKIDCFEPMKENFECLKLNTKDLLGIDLYNTALGDSIGGITLYTTAKNTNSGSATMFSVGELTVPNQVLCEKLDTYDLSPTFIKIDVQGAELKVFKGGVKMLTRCKPSLIVECEGGNSESIEFLKTLGYGVIGQAKNDYLLKFGI